jgi:hypothetical protein
VYQPVEDQFLLFPMIEKDFERWQTEGAAVFLRDKAVLTPGVENMKGLVHTKKPLDTAVIRNWEVQVDIDMGNDA